MVTRRRLREAAPVVPRLPRHPNSGPLGSRAIASAGPVACGSEALRPRRHRCRGRGRYRPGPAWTASDCWDWSVPWARSARSAWWARSARSASWASSVSWASARDAANPGANRDANPGAIPVAAAVAYVTARSASPNPSRFAASGQGGQASSDARDRGRDGPVGSASKAVSFRCAWAVEDRRGEGHAAVPDAGRLIRAVRRPALDCFRRRWGPGRSRRRHRRTRQMPARRRDRR